MVENIKKMRKNFVEMIVSNIDTKKEINMDNILYYSTNTDKITPQDFTKYICDSYKMTDTSFNELIICDIVPLKFYIELYVRTYLIRNYHEHKKIVGFVKKYPNSFSIFSSYIIQDIISSSKEINEKNKCYSIVYNGENYMLETNKLRDIMNDFDKYIVSYYIEHQKCVIVSNEDTNDTIQNKILEDECYTLENIPEMKNKFLRELLRIFIEK